MRIREALVRLRDRQHREQLSAELNDELRFHLSMLERDYLQQGYEPNEAHRRAMLQLGNNGVIQQDTRATWRVRMLDDLLQDVRYAVRVLRNNIAFTAAVVLTLALGIGANTAIFSVVNAVLLRPLPYADSDRLYSLWTAPTGSPTDRNPTSYPDLLDWQEQNTVFTGIGGYAFNVFELTEGGRADVLRGILGSPTLYQVLGATPLLGRLPLPEEERNNVVAISHRVWTESFAGDSTIIGRNIVLENRQFTVVGVMPPGFHFPTPDIDLWMTLAHIHAQGAASENPWLSARGMRGYRAVARLRPQITAATAEAQINELMDRLGETYPERSGGLNIRLSPIREDTVGEVRRPLLLVMGAAGMVLLLACANVAHLLLARMSARTREIAVRRALGADRSRMTKQLLTESLLLSLLGGAAGLFVAAFCVNLLVRLSPPDLPRLENVGIDATTLGFALLASIGTGLLFGLAPAFNGWGDNVDATLREQGRSSVSKSGGRLRAVLMSAEVAFALMLLIGAGLMLRSFATLTSKHLGMMPEGVTVFAVTFPQARYAERTDRATGMQRVIEALQGIPGVRQVGASTSMPPTRMQESRNFAVVGDPAPSAGEEPKAVFVPMTVDFLTTLGVPLLKGRGFDVRDEDASAPPVVIVSEELARRYFGERDPIGMQLEFGEGTRTIVGVVGDVSYRGVAMPVGPVAYVPWAQSPFTAAWVAVRASVNEQALVPAIRRALHANDPLMNARSLSSLDALVHASIGGPRLQTWLLTMFGALALSLAAVGIYGVVAYGVAQRTTEIGLRLAVGAPPSAVIGLLMRRGLMPVVVGLAIGVFGAWALSRFMAGLLNDISPSDVTTYVGVTVLLAFVAVLAAYIPTARATRMGPLRALRME